MTIFITILGNQHRSTPNFKANCVLVSEAPYWLSGVCVTRYLYIKAISRKIIQNAFKKKIEKLLSDEYLKTKHMSLLSLPVVRCRSC